jgi:methylenetetrahydrofolate reductase (NADPH)
MGIEVPILPGIKPITNLRQINTLPRDFHISLPSELVESMEIAATPKEIRQQGLNFSRKLCQDLIDFGVPGIHLYTMGKGTATYELLKQLF